MELTSYMRTMAALVLVLGMILAVLWLLRRFGVPGMVPRQMSTRRLRVVESAAVDSRRRLVLLRRDDKEHLVLVGPDGDLLIETGIAAPSGEEK